MPVPTPVICPNCTTAVDSANVNIQSCLAKCTYCHSVFPFDGKITVANPKPATRKIVPMPPQYEVLQLRSSLDISFDWKSNSDSFLWWFSLLWNSIVIPAALIIFMMGEWFGLLIISLHLLVAFCLAYYFVATWFNKTHIIVTDQNLTITHSPIPAFWRKQQAYASGDIDQLFCIEYKASTTNGDPDYAYMVKAIIKNEAYNKPITLISGLAKPEQALYIEQQIEHFLGIKNRLVTGELPY